MTLPASDSISLSDVLAKIQKSNPSRALLISLALAGKSALPISMSNLYGKS